MPQGRRERIVFVVGVLAVAGLLAVVAFNLAGRHAAAKPAAAPQTLAGTTSATTSSSPVPAPSVAQVPSAEAAPRQAQNLQSRPPAFAVAGAPKEPLTEMPLPDRARLLGRWLSAHPDPTATAVKHWLYQNAWVVTGARYGWWRGAEALRTLVEVDRRTVASWGIGSKTEAVAAAALAEVEARTPAAAPATPGAVSLTLRATQDSWFEVRADSAEGKVLFSGILSQGGALQFGRRVWVRFGSAANLGARLNGKALALPPGTYDAIVDAGGLRQLGA